MKKTTNLVLLSAISASLLAGCSGLLEPIDLSVQAEELMSFEVDLDQYVPTALSASAFTDDQESNLAFDLHANDHYDEEPAAGVQMTEFHGAYSDIQAAFTGLDHFYEHRNQMVDSMKHGNMFGRGHSFRNIIGDIDYQVTVENGVSTLIADFDLGTYEVQRTTDEATGDVITWGTFTNPYGTEISFKTTNEDLLQVSIDRADDRADTYLAFERIDASIVSQLVRYKTDGVDIDVIGAGYAIFNDDYSYVGYNNSNAVGWVRDYLEMEVYATADSSLIASHRQFTILQTSYDVIVLPIVTLGNFVEGDIERVGRGAFSIQDVQFPTQTELLLGTANYAVIAEGRVRYTGRSEGITSRSLESLTLQITPEEYALNGLPTPFVAQATDFDVILSNLDVFMADYATWSSSLTLQNVTFSLPEANPITEEEVTSSSESTITSSSSSSEIISGTGV